MNILWVEDFDVPFNGVADLVKPLLSALSPVPDREEFEITVLQNCSDKDNRDKLNRDSFKTEIEDYFQKTSSHSVKICFNPIDAERELSNSKDMYDLFILDINLEHQNQNIIWEQQRMSEGKEIYFNVDLRKAGIFLYYKMIYDYGIPAEHICYYTHYYAETDVIREHGEAYNIKHNCFGKFNVTDLISWIEKYRDDDYIKLRRGIIDGCQSIKDEIKRRVKSKKLKDYFHFYRFYKKGKEKDRFVLNVERGNINDTFSYLDMLQNYFPPVPPINQRHHRFDIFIRVLSREWDSKVKPSYLEGNDDHDKILRSFGEIAKALRNWTSHNIFSENDISYDEGDVAFLFIVIMRTMFNFGVLTQNFEKLLLDTFGSPALSITAICEATTEQTCSSLHEKLRGSYSEIKSLVTQKKSRCNAVQYAQMYINLGNLPGFNILDVAGYKASLYRMFWHNLSCENMSIESADYSFEQFNYEKFEFLSAIGEHIYKRSFSKQKRVR